MKKSFLSVVAALLLVGCSVTDNPVQNTIDKEDVMAKMSLEDKAHFVIGTGMAGFSGDDAVIGATRSIVPGAAGTTYPLDSLGIPAIVLADGPAGLRIDATREGDSATYYCTHFPIGTLLASTWNTPHRHTASLYMEHPTHRRGGTGHRRGGEGVWCRRVAGSCS